MTAIILDIFCISITTIKAFLSHGPRGRTGLPINSQWTLLRKWVEREVDWLAHRNHKKNRHLAICLNMSSIGLDAPLHKSSVESVKEVERLAKLDL